MPVDLLELQRARKVLETFCAKRNLALRGAGKQLGCLRDGPDLLLVETRLPGTSPVERGISPLVRLVFRDNCWFLFCPDQRGGWTPYPHLSRAKSIGIVLDELEQAPLHVHW